MINKMVKISGMTKQGYIRTRLECRNVVVVGNPRVYKGLKDVLAETNELLKTIAAKGDIVDDETLEIIRVITEVLGEMKVSQHLNK